MIGPHRLFEERGSAATEFVLVSALLSVLALTLLQLGMAAWVRNVAQDAAVDAAFHAALADSDPAEAAPRVAERMAAVADPDAIQTTVAVTDVDGVPSVRVTVRTVLPLIGLIGLPAAMEVSADAPQQRLG